MTDEEARRRAFGARMRAARKARGISSLQRLRDLIVADKVDPAPPSVTALGEYEKGNYAPPVHRAQIIDRLLECDGELFALLYDAPPEEFVDLRTMVDTLADRLDAFEAQFEAMASSLAALADRLEGGGPSHTGPPSPQPEPRRRRPAS